MRKLNSSWRAVAAMFALNGALWGIWASRIPAIAEKLDLSHQLIGTLLLCMAMGAILSFPVAGYFSDKLGAFFTTRLTALLYLLSLILLSLAPSSLWLAVLLVIFGATHGAMDVSMNAWATEVEKQNQTPQMSSFHAMFSLGAGIGAATGYVAVQLELGLLQHFLFASIGIGVFGFWVANIRWQSTRHETNAKPPLFAVPRVPLLLVGIVAFACAIGEGGMADWSAIFLTKAVQVNEAQAAIGYTMFSVGMVTLRLAGGKIIDMFGRTAIVRYGALSAFVGCMLAVTFTDYYLSLVGFVLMGCGYALVIPIALSKAAEMSPGSPGIAIAGVSTFGYGGLLLGPPIVGFTAELISIRFAFLIFAGLACIMFILAQAIEGCSRERVAQ